MRKNAEKTIEYLKKKSVFIIFQNSREIGFRKVDLHHLHVDESEELLFVIFESIRNGYYCSNRQHVFQVEIITGKGKHSKNGAVLLPYLLQSLKEQGHKICSSAEGKILCNVRQ